MARLFPLVLLVAGVLFFAQSLPAKTMIESKKPVTKQQRVERINARVQDMSVKLSLNQQQRDKIHEILTTTKEQTLKLMGETGEKILELKRQGEAEIDAVFTTQQREKYRNMTKEAEDEEEFMKVYKSSY